MAEWTYGLISSSSSFNTKTHLQTSGPSKFQIPLSSHRELKLDMQMSGQISDKKAPETYNTARAMQTLRCGCHSHSITKN